MSGFGHYNYGGNGVNQAQNAHGLCPGSGTCNQNGNLDDLVGTGSSSIRKPLPLRQQTDKPTLKYTGIVSNTNSPLMVTGNPRPPAVPLFSHSDIQYLRQQVQQFSTPPSSLNNVLFTSFVNKPSNGAPSAYTHTVTNSPVPNININIQPPPTPHPPPTNVPRNPFTRPISAQDIQSPEALIGGLLVQSSSGGNIASNISPETLLSHNGEPSMGSSSGLPTKVFIKPQVNGTQYKSEKRSTHSTINVKENKLGNIIYKPNGMAPNEPCLKVITNGDLEAMDKECTSSGVTLQSVISNMEDGLKKSSEPSRARQLVVNAVIKPSTQSIVVTVPQPPSGKKSTNRTLNHVGKATNAVTTVTKSTVQTPSADSYGFVTNIPDHPGPKASNKQNGDCGKHTHSDDKVLEQNGAKNSHASRDTATHKLMDKMIPKSSIPRPGAAVRSRPSSASGKKKDSESYVRNLNYTPTKPYHEINNNKVDSRDSVRSPSADENNVREKNVTPVERCKTTPEMKNNETGSLNNNNKTMYYHKTSKTEIVLHKPPAKPVRKSASQKITNSWSTLKKMPNGSTQSVPASDDNEEWEDELETEDSNSISRGCSRGTPGDDDDDDLDDDDENDDDLDDEDDVGFEDDGIDDIEDDVEYGSDDEHSSLSRAGSARSRTTSIRIRTATKRLLGLSIKEKERRPNGVVRAHSLPRPSTGKTRPYSAVSTLSSDSDLQPALTPSLFPNIPPTINFVNVGDKVEQLPWEIRRLFKWRMSPITPNVVKNCISRSHFKPTKKNHDWLGYWGKHMKAQAFKAIREYQKVNHFPGSFQIGRKDRLWRNLSRLQVHFGKKEFGFFPQTFVLPCDSKQLKRAWDDGGNKQKWIIKPPASARGIGIKVIHKWNQIPKKRSVIVQRYLAHPFLINDSKFDLRIYVYISSYDPLRCYVYDDGLVRFASCKYSQAMKNLSNKYMHLTNYSINKKNDEYKANSDDSVCQGHKWSLKALWGYMKKQGINTNAIWQSMLDLIIKTIISSESCINSLIKSNVHRKQSCHELFGFDIMLDENLKPWIIEVNISPSLHSNSQLDINVKGGMIKDLLNLSGFMIPGKHEITPAAGAPPEPGKFTVPAEICVDRRMYPNTLCADEKAKHAYYCQRANDEYSQQTILDTITPDDLRILTESVDECSRKGNFVRAFPSFTSHKYLRFFDAPRYYNLLLNTWVQRYHRMEHRGIAMLERLCERGLHLEKPTDDPREQWSPPSGLPARDSRGASSAPGYTRPSMNLPKLKKRSSKTRAGNSLTSGGSSTASSTTSIASSLTPMSTCSTPGGSSSNNS